MGISSRIQTGGKEPIEVLVLDITGTPLTAAVDILVKLRRLSDGFFFDWSDDTFKSVGSVTTLSSALTEIDATNVPGEYKFTKAGHVNGFDTSTITNSSPNDTYEVTVFQFPGVTASNMPQVGEIKEGDFVDNIDAPLSVIDTNVDTLLARLTVARAAALDDIPGIDASLTLVSKILRNRLELTDGMTGNWVLYDDDSSTVLLTWDVADKVGGSVSLPGGAPARRTKGV